MKAIAFCGLACCVCSENKGCVGCQDGGYESHGWCKNYNCCKEKGLNGCLVWTLLSADIHIHFWKSLCL